jgi:hypothetical protein
MDRSKPIFRWVFLHLLIFCCSPFFFILTGLLVGGLITLTPSITSLPRSYRPAILLLSPLLSGGLLGISTGALQIFFIRKLAPKSRASRWLWMNGLGTALAFLAAAWAYNDSTLPNPLPLAAVFSGAVYGLAAGLPQARLLKKQVENTWRWTLAASIGGGLSFIFAISPVWLAEGNLYYWLVLPLCAAAGVLYGSMTGLGIFSFPQFRQFFALIPGSVQEKTIQ